MGNPGGQKGGGAFTLPGESGAELFVFEDYGSLNTKSNRPAIDDKEFSWNENWIPIGAGNLRTLYAEGPTLYNSGAQEIIYKYPFNLGDQNYIAVFFSDGTAVQVSNPGGQVTQIASIGGTFYDPAHSTDPPQCVQWQAKYLVIVGSNKNLGSGCYYAWDGSHLFSPGTLGPDVTITNGGTNNTYTSPPPVTAFGGSGSGATFTATLDPSSGTVDTVQVNNPGIGYKPGDQVQLSFGGGPAVAQVGPAVLSAQSGISGVTILNGGTGATTSTTLTLTGGGGSGGQVVVTGLSNGSITQISVMNPGNGYTSSPTVAQAGAGNGLEAIVQIGGGQIASIPISTGGTGYTSPPQVIIDPPNSDALPVQQATAHAVIASGAVTSIVVDNPGIGYVAGSTINVRLVGGNGSAEGSVDLMPFGQYGNSVETYQGAIFVVDGNNVSFTSPGTLTDFSSSGGGGNFIASDNFLRYKVTALKQSTGFLYLMGDSSINVLSNLQTTAAPAPSSQVTTTYSNANIDPQIGCAWRDTAVSFGRALMFANPTGIYALYGGAAQKVSQPLDNLFSEADFTNPPSAAVCIIYGIPVFLFSFNTLDPYLHIQRTIMAAWDGQKWFVASQIKTQTFLSTQEINSQLTAWATDGTNVYPLFETPSESLIKTFQTKLRTAPSHILSKQINALYLTAETSGGVNNYLDVGIDSERGNGPLDYIPLGSALIFVGRPGPITFVGAGPITFTASGLIATMWAPSTFVQSNYGRYLGFTATTTSEDLTLIMLSALYADYSPIAP